MFSYLFSNKNLSINKDKYCKNHKAGSCSNIPFVVAVIAMHDEVDNGNNNGYAGYCKRNF